MLQKASLFELSKLWKLWTEIYFNMLCFVRNFIMSRLPAVSFMMTFYYDVTWTYSIASHSHAVCPPFFGSETDFISLLFLFFFFVFLLSDLFEESPRLRPFKTGRDEIWQYCSPRKYVSFNGDRFFFWLHTFKSATVTLFQTEKCCHLVSARAASVQHISIRQFLIRS